MPRTLLPKEEPSAQSSSPDDLKAFIDSAHKEESDDDETDGFERMASVKVEPADADSSSDNEEDQDAPSQDNAASTNSTALCSNDFKLVWDTGKLEKTYHKEGKKVWCCRFCGTS
jgi:1,4-alpha-glucan branching enzyme